MTPMVDLGFLLITFFIFTSALANPVSTDLFMPKDGPPSDLPESKAVTALLSGGDSVYVYQGGWETAAAGNSIAVTGYSIRYGLGKWIREHQQALGGEKEGLMLLIKPGPASSYQNLIDALDAAVIHNVKRYAVLDPSEAERRYMLAQP